jgi:hypothetical protein
MLITESALISEFLSLPLIPDLPLLSNEGSIKNLPFQRGSSVLEINASD